MRSASRPRSRGEEAAAEHKLRVTRQGRGVLGLARRGGQWGKRAPTTLPKQQCCRRVSFSDGILGHGALCGEEGLAVTYIRQTRLGWVTREPGSTDWISQLLGGGPGRPKAPAGTPCLWSPTNMGMRWGGYRASCAAERPRAPGAPPVYKTG